MAHTPQALPPYRRIAAQIRARIDSGELQPGDHIPSVREIVRDEGVSTATATRVAAVLRDQGVAESVPGVGTIVSGPAAPSTPPRAVVLEEGHDLTDTERRAIGSLQRLARRWPQSLTLASMGGSLVVVRTAATRFSDGGDAVERTQAAVAYVEGIPNTGGDW